MKRQKDFHNNKYIPINSTHSQTIEDTAYSEDPIITNTADVYHRIFEYVYSKYDQEEAAIYKAHTIDGFTFDQLAEATRFKRSRCYEIVKAIRADVQANKEYFLAAK